MLKGFNDSYHLLIWGRVSKFGGVKLARPERNRGETPTIVSLGEDTSHSEVGGVRLYPGLRLTVEVA